MSKKIFGTVVPVSVLFAAFHLHAESTGVTFTEVPARVVDISREIKLYESTRAKVQLVSVSENGVIASQDETGYYKWSTQVGLTPLGQTSSLSYYNANISGDGNVVMFSHENGLRGDTPVFIGDQQTTLSEPLIKVSALSYDGRVVGGKTTKTFGRPLIKSLVDGSVKRYTGPGLPSNTQIKDFSNAGNVQLIMGGYRTTDEAWLYDSNTNKLVKLPFYNTQFNNIADLSGDGTTVVGIVANYDCVSAGNCVMLWSESRRDEIGSFFYPRATNFDASIIVGMTYDKVSGATTGVIWDSENGVRNIVDVLLLQGIDISAWSDVQLSDISENGGYITGFGTNPEGDSRAFLISLKAECRYPKL